MRHALDDAELSDINVTPLVDVMLVLLVIFMITAPLMRESIHVALPKAATSQRTTSSGELTITLTKEHLVYLQGQVVSLQELRHRLAARSGSTPLMIEADRYAYVAKLIELWDLCRQAGFREIHIATLHD